MADRDTLAALFSGMNGSSGSSRGNYDLDQFDKILNQNNLWNMAAAPVMQAKFDNSTWSPSTTLGVSAAQSFLGALLGGMGNRQNAAQYEKLNEVLPTLYQDPSSVTLPEGMDAEAFGTIKANALRENAARTISKSQKESDLKDSFFAEIYSKNPSLAVSSMPEVAKKFGIGEVAEQKNSLSDLPPTLQTRAMEEAQTIKNKEKSLSFIDEKFEQAKKLTGPGTTIASIFGVPTYSANELKGLKDSLLQQIDAMNGREMNSDVRQRLLDLTPTGYDSDEQIDKKKANFKEFVASLAKSTPVLDSIGAAGSYQSVPSGGSEQPPQDDAAMRSFIRKGLAQNKTRAEIEAEWVKAGGRL